MGGSHSIPPVWTFLSGTRVAWDLTVCFRNPNAGTWTMQIIFVRFIVWHPMGCELIFIMGWSYKTKWGGWASLPGFMSLLSLNVHTVSLLHSPRLNKRFRRQKRISQTMQTPVHKPLEAEQSTMEDSWWRTRKQRTTWNFRLQRRVLGTERDCKLSGHKLCYDTKDSHPLVVLLFLIP